MLQVLVQAFTFYKTFVVAGSYFTHSCTSLNLDWVLLQFSWTAVMWKIEIVGASHAHRTWHQNDDDQALFAD